MMGGDDNDVSVFVGKISLLFPSRMSRAGRVKDMTIRANFRAISRLVGLLLLLCVAISPPRCPLGAVLVGAWREGGVE